MRTEPDPGAQPITSGFSSASVANSYSTTEHCLLSHRTPIATKVECFTFPQDYRTQIVTSECSTIVGKYRTRAWNQLLIALVVNMETSHPSLSMRPRPVVL